ncbi:hypothetical protein QOZ80_1AG0042280 [Eleusine coracana subsp. coracana]|nr:hypothetical protein QOZ80_1AG0042280 [Eleusine coracana subsp. coracana]
MGIRRSRWGVELVEECCFECKDGGDNLRACDYRNCLKAYHPHCTASREGDDFPPGEKFICLCHTCVNCSKSPDYQCLCCPNYSVCHNCLGKVELFKVGKQNKGLCRLCLDRAILIEKNAADSRAKSNYQDSDLSLVLFKDYWDIIKDTERLTLLDLQAASGILYRGLNHTREAYSEKFPDEDLLGDSDDNEQTFLSGPKSKPDKTNMSMKRKRSKKKRFVGWGTKELIEFLSFVGKDTKEPLDEAEVVGVVQEYIKQKRLFLGDKKKYFEGDDKLRPLFKRRKVKYNMLHSKLRIHFAANAASEDESLDGSEDDDGPMKRNDKLVWCRKLIRGFQKETRDALPHLISIT